MTVYQLGAAAVIGAVCIVTVRRQAGEIALLLGVALCCMLLGAVGQAVSSILTLIQMLAETARIENALLEPLVKVTAIALVTGLTAQICRDAGIGSAALTMELCGGLCALSASLPLIEAVFELLAGLV